MKNLPRVVFWVGPTASGKSALSLQMAERFSADIVNADSIQFYQRVDIGSAKPTPEDRRCRPHYLFDLVAPPQAVTAGDFHRLFFDHMGKVQAGALGEFGPQFVVGGTGFYIQAIEKGIPEVPKSDPTIRARLESELADEHGPTLLHQRLQRLDPESAARIHLNDHYRILRALEVIESTGKKWSESLRSHRENTVPFPFPLLKFGLRLEKDELVQRIEERTRQMLRSGLIEEVEKLVSEGYADWEPLASVGYKECLQFLRGEISSRAELEAKIILETTQLAKKQRTWFQRDPEIIWVTPQQGPEVEDRLRHFLNEDRN